MERGLVLAGYHSPIRVGALLGVPGSSLPGVKMVCFLNRKREVREIIKRRREGRREIKGGIKGIYTPLECNSHSNCTDIEIFQRY